MAIKYQYIDEQVFLIKSCVSINQYLPMKSCKWKIKVWARCGIRAMFSDCKIYVRQEPFFRISMSVWKIWKSGFKKRKSIYLKLLAVEWKIYFLIQTFSWHLTKKKNMGHFNNALKTWENLRLQFWKGKIFI